MARQCREAFPAGAVELPMLHLVPSRRVAGSHVHLAHGHPAHQHSKDAFLSVLERSN